jgi:hypothetical protein
MPSLSAAANRDRKIMRINPYIIDDIVQQQKKSFETTHSDIIL